MKKLRSFFLCAIVLVVLVALVGRPTAVRADEGTILNQNVVVPANNAIKEALRVERAARSAKAEAAKAAANSDAPKQTAQARPIGEQEAPALDPALVKGFNYTLDVSSAWPLGHIGHQNANMPGGVDAVLAYGFSKHTRFYAGYYQLQEFPLGFDTGVVPVYLQGLGPPIATQDLALQQLDVTTKEKFTILALQNLVVLGKNLPLPLPVIISPIYISRTASIAAQGNGDTQTIEVNGFPQTVHLRTSQIKTVAFTVPFVSSPKIFATITLAPQWQMNISGANQTNHMQLLQLLYMEYRATDKTTIFFQPSRAPAYLPTDPFPEHLASFIYGISHNLTKHTFVQTTISTGTPTNVKELGITKLTCLQLPCAPAQIAPTIGALKATQVQLIFGIGTPSAIPL